MHFWTKPLVGQAVLCEEDSTFWGLYPCSNDAVDPCSHVFLIFVPHIVLNIFLPEEVCELW